MSTNDNKNTQQHLDYDNGECSICLRPHTHKSRLLCGHVFCYKCIHEWSKLKFECPLCKQVFNSFVTADLDSTLLTGLIDQRTLLPHEDSRPQLPEIIPLIFTICMDGNTTDLQRFVSNPRGFMSKLASDYGKQQTKLNGRKGHNAVFMYKNVTDEMRNLLTASFERPGIRRLLWVARNVEFSKWILLSLQ